MATGACTDGAGGTARNAATFLDDMWSDGLTRLKAAAEREEWAERTRAERASLRQQRKGTQT